MKYKKGFIFICLIVCLFSIASACAGDLNETVIGDDDQNDDLIQIDNPEDNEDVGDELSSSDDEIESASEYNFVENHDIVVNASDTVVYQVKLVDNDNKPYSYNKVTFTFNNEDYIAKTDYEGYASYVLGNLNPGTYTIKASHGDVQVSNKIQVKNHYSTENYYECDCEAYLDDNLITVEAYYYEEEFNDYLKFYMYREYEENGETYLEEYEYIRYMSSGRIQFAVPETIGKGIYYYTINYPIDGGDENTFEGEIAIGVERNATVISFLNTVEDSEGDVFINYTVLDDDEESDRILVSLNSINGKTLKGAKIRLEINDEIYIAKTNAKGIASFFPDLPSGVYVATATFNGNSLFYPVIIKIKVICTSSKSQEEEPEFTPVVSLETSLNNNDDIIAIDCSNNLKENIVVWVNGEKRYNQPIDYDSIYGNNVYLDLKDLQITEANSYGIIIKYVDLEDNEFDIKSYVLKVTGEEQEKTPTKIEFSYSTHDSEYVGQVIHLKSGDENAVVKGELNTDSGNSLSNKPINIAIDGKSYRVTTDANGIFQFPCANLNVGNRILTATFSGDDKYKNATAKIMVIVESPEIVTPIKKEDFIINVEHETINENTIEIVNVEGKSGLKGSYMVLVDGYEVYSKNIDNSFQANKLSLYLDNLEIYDCGNYNVTINYVDEDGEELELINYILTVNWLKIHDELYNDEVINFDELVELNLPDGITVNLIVYVDNEKYFNITLDDSFDGNIELEKALEFGSYNVTVIYNGNYHSVTLSKMVEVTYRLAAFQPTVIGIHDPISSPYVDLDIVVPEDASGKVTVYLNKKQYDVDYKNKSYLRILNEDLILGTSKGIISLTGDEKYPDKNVSFNFYVEPEFNKYYRELVNTDENFTFNLYNNMSGVFNIYKYEELSDKFELLMSTDFSKGYGSVPVSKLVGNGDYFLVEIQSYEYYYEHFYSLRIIENNPKISVNLKLDAIELGDDVVFDINVNTDSEEISFILDGRFIKSTRAYTNSLTEKISGLSIGSHIIKIEIDEDYVKTFNVVVKEKSTPQNSPVVEPSSKPTTPKVADKIYLALKTVKVKKSAKKLTIQVTLKVNGKGVKNKIIKFKFNKKTYKARTNTKGVAKIKIAKKVLKKLKKGKKVTYTATYGKITKKVTVKVKK